MKTEYINQSLITPDNLSSNHNLGLVSDIVYNTFEEAFNNIHTSYTTSVYEGFMDNKRYLSLSLKKMIPLVGNRIAYLIDILGNVACAELLNDLTLKKRLNYLYGKPTQTISEVLGKNLFINNLTATGLQLVNLINLHDYKHFEKVLGMYYPKETKLEKRKRIFKLIIFYLIFSLVILFIYKNNAIWTNYL